MAQHQAASPLLQLAVIVRQVDLARLFLARGARADERDREGLAALHYATWDGHMDLARTLLERGADASARDARGLTPLWYARRLGREPMVILLRSRGAAE